MVLRAATLHTQHIQMPTTDGPTLAPGPALPVPYSNKRHGVTLVNCDDELGPVGPLMPLSTGCYLLAQSQRS